MPRHDKTRTKLFNLPIPGTVSLAYLLIAIAWIFFSDRALGALFSDPEQLKVWQTFKGSAYVLVTALLLYLTLRRIFGRIKRVQKRLEESENRYRMLIESQMDLVVKVNREGRFEFVSPSYCELFGKTREELIGQVFFPLVHEDDRAATEKAFKSVFDPPHRVYMEQRAMTRHGWRWLAWQDSAILDAQGCIAGIVGVGRDITEQKQVEEALIRSERKFRNLFENMITGFSLNEIICDEHGHPVDFRFLEVNPAFEQHTGLVASEVKGRKGSEVFPGADLEWMEQCGTVALSGRPMAFERYSRLVDRWLDVWLFSPEEGKFAAILSDVTERVRAQEKIRQLSTAIHQSRDVVVITDTSGSIEYVNPAFEEITGYSRDQAIGRNPRMLKSGEHPDSFYRSMWEQLAEGNAWYGVFQNRRANGRIYFEETSISPVTDEAGSIVNYVAVKRDITRERELEEQYRQAQKMEAVGRFASGVAHDFNNILQTILGQCAVLLIDTEGQESVQNDVREIQQAAKLAGSLTGQLLAFGRKQRMAIETADLNNIIEAEYRMLERLLGPKYDLQVDPAENLNPVFADIGQMEQMIMNLVANARDAMPDGGVIRAFTENVTLSGECAGAGGRARPGEYVCLSVSDSGCGMDETTIEKIFEPFFTTKSVGEGTGLGLAMIYGIVEQHDGWIDVESQPGQGSCFKVYLPVCRIRQTGESSHFNSKGKSHEKNYDY